MVDACSLQEILVWKVFMQFGRNLGWKFLTEFACKNSWLEFLDVICLQEPLVANSWCDLLARTLGWKFLTQFACNSWLEILHAAVCKKSWLENSLCSFLQGISWSAILNAAACKESVVGNCWCMQFARKLSWKFLVQLAWNGREKNKISSVGFPQICRCWIQRGDRFFLLVSNIIKSQHILELLLSLHSE